MKDITESEKIRIKAGEDMLRKLLEYSAPKGRRDSVVDLYPTRCNLCDGAVILTSNRRIYGKEYGSGKCYYCTKCGAYVGTHRTRPKEAFGILADAEMRNLKRHCHELFDKFWTNEKNGKKRQEARRKCYKKLAEMMNINVEDCHFGYFDKSKLLLALRILELGEFEKGEN